MTSMANAYADSIHNEWGPIYAVWPPESSFQLGDYGILKDSLMIKKLGNISKDFSIKIKSLKEERADKFTYTSKGSVGIKYVTKGEIGSGDLKTAKAGIEVEFSKENAIFFNASGCNSYSIENRSRVSEELVTLYRQKKWNADHIVIDKIFAVAGSIIVFSSGNIGSIYLEAQT